MWELLWLLWVKGLIAWFGCVPRPELQWPTSRLCQLTFARYHDCISLFFSLSVIYVYINHVLLFATACLCFLLDVLLSYIYFILFICNFCISIIQHNHLIILSQVSSFVFYWRKKGSFQTCIEYFANCLIILTSHSFANTDISLTNHSSSTVLFQQCDVIAMPARVT